MTNGASCAAYDGMKEAESSWTTGDGFARATSASIDGSSFRGASSTLSETDDVRERYYDALDVIAEQREELERNRRDLINTQQRLDAFIVKERERAERARAPPSRCTQTFATLLGRYEAVIRERNEEIRSLKEELSFMRECMAKKKRARRPDDGSSSFDRMWKRRKEERESVSRRLGDIVGIF